MVSGSFEWCMNGSGGDRGLAAATGTLVGPGLAFEPPGFAATASGAGEAVPASVPPRGTRRRCPHRQSVARTRSTTAVNCDRHNWVIKINSLEATSGFVTVIRDIFGASRRSSSGREHRERLEKRRGGAKPQRRQKSSARPPLRGGLQSLVSADDARKR